MGKSKFWHLQSPEGEQFEVYGLSKFARGVFPNDTHAQRNFLKGITMVKRWIEGKEARKIASYKGWKLLRCGENEPNAITKLPEPKICKPKLEKDEAIVEGKILRIFNYSEQITAIIASDLTGADRGHIKALCKTGEITAVKDSKGHWSIEKASLISFLRRYKNRYGGGKRWKKMEVIEYSTTRTLVAVRTKRSRLKKNS